MAATRSDGALRLLVIHGPWLAIVLIATVFGQWLVFHDAAIPVVSSDSLLYLSDAHALPALHGFVDPKVPPGYPIFISAVFLVAGRDNLDAVMTLQGLLFIAAIVEFYALVTTASLPRPAAAVVAALLAAAPWLVQWERYILTETFSFWATVTLFLIYVRLLRRPRAPTAAVCGLVGAALPLTRPALALVPATLFGVLAVRFILARRAGVPRTVVATCAAVFALVSYIPVAGYIAANASVNGCYCYTSISNLNLFGKIYEYGMKNYPADPKYAVISQEVQASDSINRFLESHPEYEAQNYSSLGAFARSQFFRYPRDTLRFTASEIKRVLTLDIDHAVLLAHPYACRSDPTMPYPLATGDAIQAADVPYCPKTTVSVGKLGEDVNRAIYLVIFLAYAMLPLSLALGAAMVLAHPKRERAWVLLSTSAVAASVIVSSSLVGYTAFDRLKVPVDGITLVAATLMAFELWFFARELQLALRRSRVQVPG